VPDFVERHFRYPGAWRTNRRALGWDLVRAPLNLFWAPVYVASLLMALLAQRMRLTRIAERLGAIPAGLPTRVQRHVDARIRSEILCLPGSTSTPLHSLSSATLRHYGATRTAAADIGNSLGSTVLGAVALKQFTPGGIALGLLLSAWLAQYAAAASFPLGETLGQWYYGLFPPQPTFLQQVAGVALTLSLLSVVAALSGLVVDPLQSRLGIHRRRLLRMLAHLEEDLHSLRASSYRPRDPLLARLLELIDAARGAL
jgi:hypothetical protein